MTDDTEAVPAIETDESIDTYRVVETSTIAEVSAVRIYDETLPHLGVGHREMRHVIPSLEAAIDDTIMNPTAVYASNPPHRASYRYQSTNHRYGENPMVVAVKVVEGTSALLKTAYFTDSVSGEQVWSMDDA